MIEEFVFYYNCFGRVIWIFEFGKGYIIISNENMILFMCKFRWGLGFGV